MTKTNRDLKIGDSVEAIDDNLSGVVKGISAENVTIQTQDGFELEFKLSDLIRVEMNTTLNRNLFSSKSVEDVINEKSVVKRKTFSSKKKQRYQPTMEIDLHIEKLTTSFKRMATHEILDYQLEVAKRQLDSAIKKRMQKLVFIHGVGDGVLKLELEYLIKRYDNLKFYEADYQKYGLGATEVYIPQSAM